MEGPYLLKDGYNISLVFSRIFSKVRVKADFTGLNEDVKIGIKQIRLRNIPKSTRPFSSNTISSPSEVKDGEPYLNPAERELSNGISFYLMENLQGTLREGNVSQQGKVLPQDSPLAGVCSYIEIQASYVSSEKEGDVIYRYYLGKDNVSNFDVVRNSIYLLNICFKGNGGVDENTWRVDVKELLLPL